jgi:hypothetical protein
LIGWFRGERRKDETSTDEFIDGKLSKQILNQAKIQMQELEEEYGTAPKKGAD